MTDLISDVALLVFTLYVCSLVFELKHDSKKAKYIVYGTYGLLVITYVVIVYVAEILDANFGLDICVILPSFILMFIACKHKDPRFVITFCLIASAMYILSSIQRLFLHAVGSYASLTVLLIFITSGFVLTLKFKPYMEKYNEIMGFTKDGWITGMICTVTMLAALLFISQYPAPIEERPEYYPNYAAVILVSVTFYFFFISSVIQKSRMHETNAQLEAERVWHKKAYVDVLTGVKNRMAYVKRINEFERTLNSESVYYAVLLDVNNFKTINDTLGHHKGDEILCHLAKILLNIFPRDNYRVYRIGGDEFAIIGFDVEEYDVDGRILAINSAIKSSGMSYTVSAGRDRVRYDENSAFENAFIRADAAMYEAKRKSKEQAAAAKA